MNSRILICLVLLSSFLYADILLVRDGARGDFVDYYKKALEKENLPYEVFDTRMNVCVPGSEMLTKYDAVLWICADSFHTLSNEEKQALEEYITDTSKKRALYIEGNRVISDSAFIDHGFFFRTFFNIELFRSSDLRSFTLSLPWQHPVGWGMNKEFAVTDTEEFDVMKYLGFDAEEVLFRIKNPDLPEGIDPNTTLTLGITVEDFQKRLMLLSFSPPVRDIWELETGDFASHMLRWLIEDMQNILDRVSTHDSDDSEQEASRLVTLISQDLDNGSIKEFDSFLRAKKKIPEKIFIRVITSLEKRLKRDMKWQENCGLKARLEFLEK